MNQLLPFRFVLVIVFALTSIPGAGAEDPKAGKAKISFMKDVAPIFVESCYACHNAKTAKGKYDMSSYEALMKGGKKGPAVKPHEPYESSLVLMMYGDETPAMPKDADLLDEQVVAKVDAWVKQGAVFDGPDPKADLRLLAPTTKNTPTISHYTIPTPTTALAFSPDDKSLAVAAYHEITFWDVETGALLQRWPTKSERIHELSFSPDGKSLLHAGGKAGEYGEVVVWDVATNKPAKTLFTTSDIVYAAAFSPDGKQVAAGATDRTLRLWELKSGKLLHAIENHADWILDVAFSPDGKRIFTASRDKSVKVWDQEAGEPILTFPSHSDGVYGVAVSNDGKTGTSVGADKTLRFWKASGDGKQIRSVAAHAAPVYALLHPNKGSVLYTAGADKLVKSWDHQSGKSVKTFSGHTDWVFSLALSKDGQRLAAGGWNGEVIIWNVADGKPILKFTAVPALASANDAQDTASAADPGKP